MEISLLNLVLILGLPWLIVLVVIFKSQLITLYRRIVPVKEREHEFAEILADIAEIAKDHQTTMKQLNTKVVEIDRKLQGIQHTMGMNLVDPPVDDDEVNADPEIETGPELPITVMPRRPEKTNQRRGMNRYT